MPPGKGLFFFFAKMNVLCILNGMVCFMSEKEM